METFWFWLTAAAMTLLVAAVLVRALYRGADTAAPGPEADLQVYRDQLAEADRDLARGTLTETEAQRVKTEISRRILDADRNLAAQPAARPRTALALPAALALGACLGALAIYNATGVPWYPDMPLQTRLAMANDTMANRPSQAQAVAAAPALPPPVADAEFLALMDKLRAAVDPATATDLRGLDLLARNEAALGNYTAAETAQRRLITIKGNAATAEDFAALAELMIRAAGGYISPEAEAELIEALERDPRNGTARYFSGLMFAQGGRYDRSFALWQPLLDESPPDAPWVAPIRDQIEEVAMRAGVTYELPAGAAPAGPSAEDIAAAADMTPEERQAMIEGMVAQRMDRLATEGGSAQEWAELIRSLGVLGRLDEAQSIHDEAKTRFAGRDADLALLDQAATDAGLAP